MLLIPKPLTLSYPSPIGCPFFISPPTCLFVLFFGFVGGPVSVIVVTCSEGLFIGAWATLRNLEEGKGLMCLPHPHNDGMFTYLGQVFK